jgi:hypothetical protein
MPMRARPGFTRREISAAAAGFALAGASSLPKAAALTPEHFGARGDGTTDDTRAFAALAAEVNRRGGGEVELRPVTYLVGRQAADGPGGYAFMPAPILEFLRCEAPLVIRGNRARLRCAPGLRYGTFDRATGRPTRHSMPFVQAGELATPYRVMIRVEDCTGPVEISDLELDGNLRSLRIGGQYGDTGWQIPAIGIHLVNNKGAERLSRIHAHHHALDGILIDGAEARSAMSTLHRVRSEYNGRQGCSITGGSNYGFTDCAFSNTGKAGLSSAPGAGVDIEAEAGKRIRDLRFAGCTFSNNSGPGLVADSGDCAGAALDNCNFVGTTNWAVWPNKPRFRFSECSFVGAIVHAFGDADPDRACQFHHCSFRDDPALSPNGLVYGGGNPSHPVADLPHNDNVLFDHCDFNLTHRLVLPWTTNVTIFADCTMSQRAPAQSYPRGTFVGHNRIRGNVNLYSARIRGELILNGRTIERR